MRYKFNQIAPSGKRQYFIAGSVEDFEIMQGLVANALLHTPRTKELAKTRQRLASMNKALVAAIKAADELGDNNEQKQSSQKATV